MNLLSNKLIIAASLTVISMCTRVDAVHWPLLDSEHSSVHRTIIKSILKKENIGGKFHGHWFVSQGNAVTSEHNKRFKNSVGTIIEAMNANIKVEIRPTTEPSSYNSFTKHCLYKVLIDGVETDSRFVLYNRDALSFSSSASPADVDSEEDHRGTTRHSIGRPIQGIGEILLGHGARSARAQVGDRQIEELFARHHSNPVLGAAFSLIEGADLAHAQDRKVLINSIRGIETSISATSVVGLINNDKRVLKKIQNISTTRNASTMFRDQLKEMLNFNVLENAKRFIENNSGLLRGVIPRGYEKATGGKLLTLKTALFYIAMAKKKAVGASFGGTINKLSSFYPGTIPTGNASIKRLLEETNLFYNGKFYTAALGYVKNADRSVAVPRDTSGLNIHLEAGRRLASPEMFFTDCSGFVAKVARMLNPDNRWLQSNRFMSWHLSGVYDRMINRQQSTSDRFFDANGRQRALTAHERGHMGNNPRARALKELFEPVLNPRHNVQPGDILVTRHAEGRVEGHVMIIVDRDPSDPDKVIIAEMTRADVGGTRHGYNWRKISLSNPGMGKVSRVLRFR